MKSRIVFLLLVFFLCAVNLYAQSDCKSGKKCCGATSFANCPNKGCGGDPELNKAKNRTDIESASAATDKTILEIANFTRPAKWKRGTKRGLLQGWGEGSVVRVSLFLKKITHYTSGAEACNCNLKKESNNDFHIILVRNRNDPEEESLTAEISPRIRPNGWTFEKLNRLTNDRKYVRVTGWAMLDTAHLNSSTPKRKTHWEIHPVTRFEVCMGTVAQCNAGSSWVNLEDVP